MRYSSTHGVSAHARNADRGGTHGVSLAELFPDGRFHCGSNIRVSSCCSAAQHCQPGDLFVFLQDDGSHDQVQEAIDRGAKAILSERLLPVSVPQCIVSDVASAFAMLCQRLAGEPAQDVRVLGIAGHRGKTACQTMTSRVLEAGGHQPAEFGSMGSTDGFGTYPRSSTAMSSAQYAQWLARVRSQGCSHAVTELAREPVVQHMFDAVPLQTLVLTGLTTSTHRLSATPKTRVYAERLLGQLRPQGLVVANVDCPVVRDLVRTLDHPVLTVGLEADAELRAQRIEYHASEQTFLLEAGQRTTAVRSRIIGNHHLRHCLLAIATGLGMGIELSQAVAAIESIQRIPGNLERVECGQPFSVFSDAATSANQLRAALQTLREVTSGRLICVFGQGDQRRPEVSALRGHIVERYADLGVITSDCPREREPLRIVHDVLDGYRKPARAHVMPNRTRAIEWALDGARPGDTILLAGPHNRRLARSDDDFPADVDVARFCLFHRDIDLDTKRHFLDRRNSPSWN